MYYLCMQALPVRDLAVFGATCLAFLCAPSAMAAGDSVEERGERSTLVMGSAAVVEDDGFANGCWVRFHESTNHRGAQLTLVGPLAFPGTKLNPTWWRRWRSAVVGPKARLTIFEGGQYRGNSSFLNPHQRAGDLRALTGRAASVGSVRLDCSTS
jgi:hypothetical protein